MKYREISVFCFLTIFLLIGCENSDKKETKNESINPDSYELVKDWPQLPDGFVLGNPTGIGIDTAGDVFVFHRASRRWSNPFPEEPISDDTILKFDRNSGKMLESWGDGLFIMPHGLHVDYENNIWITDVGLHQIFKFSHDGDLLMTLGEVQKVTS